MIGTFYFGDPRYFIVGEGPFFLNRLIDDSFFIRQFLHCLKLRMNLHLRLTGYLKSCRQSHLEYLARVAHVVISYPLKQSNLRGRHQGGFVENLQDIFRLVLFRRLVMNTDNNSGQHFGTPKRNNDAEARLNPASPLSGHPISKIARNGQREKCINKNC